MTRVEASVGRRIAQHRQGPLLIVELDDLLDFSLCGYAFVSRPFFLLEKVSGIDRSILVSVNLDTDKMALAIKLVLFEKSILVVIYFQALQFTLLVHMGNLVDPAVFVGVSLNYLVLRGQRARENEP
jgi:hypothetical protein